MVTTVKTWTATINRTLGSTTDQGVQYSTFMYEWSQQLILAGWTHVRSCNGTALDTGTNLWTSAAAIDWGLTASSESRSFIILQAPATWGAPVGADRFHLAIDCQNSSADTTPQNCFIYFATTAITATTTTATLTLPTNRNFAFTSNIQILGWTAPAAARASFWRTTAGDVFWFTKLLSDGDYTECGYVFDPSNAAGNWRGIAGVSGLTAISNTHPWGPGNFQGGTIGFSDLGNTGGLAVEFISPTQTFTNWSSTSGGATPGADYRNLMMYTQASAGTNTTTQANRRYYGVLPDLWFTQSTAFNLVDATDTDPVVLRGFSRIALPVPAGTAMLE